ncbi:transcription antiterminator [Thermophilibacter provencensis]|uniref:BglG family transcription antiterminator n=1 Tax=Thermophilibacter provencensis TaxID=1852386 RepID=UPI0029438376|nr:transcription antiterminator [Thermophilibacter provencensis]
MILKKRQISVLRAVSEDEVGVLLSEIMAEYGISRRTLYYDIRDINDWLSERGLGAVAIDRQRLVGEGLSWCQVARAVGIGLVHPLSAAERQSMVFVRIALSGERETISSMTDTFGISRNTVISDVKELKRAVRPMGLVISSNSGMGYEVIGDELTIRKRIWFELQRLSAAGCVPTVRRFLQETLTRLVDNDIDYYELCRSLIKQYESDFKTRCFLDSNGLEGMMIQVSWLRGLQGHKVAMEREEELTLMGTISYRSVRNSVAKLKSVGITVPSQEVLYITSLLLGIKTTDFALQSEEDEYVATLSERLIDNFERVGCLTFQNKEYVREQLSHHIRPLYYRQKYGISVHNPLATEVQEMYPMAFEFVRRAAVESGMGQLSEGELAYLTIYLSSDLDSRMLENGETSANKVLLIGADNMSTATLVKDQVFEACGIDFEYEYAEPGNVRRWALDRYALVISLVPLPRELHSDNLVEVTPFLSDENKHSVYNVLRGNRIISRYDALIEGIVDIVGRSAPEGAAEWLASDRLHFELFRYFDDRDRGFMGPLNIRLDESHISSDRVVLFKGVTWREAVLSGARELQGSCSKSRLVERMGNIIEGSRLLYYHMSEDVTVVRCPMQGDEGAHVEARVVVAPGPISFPDGRSSQVVICVSTINRYSHWGMLYSIYQNFSNREYIEQIINECDFA